jgi:hypothetical protein
VVAISNNEEDILQNGREESLEEGVARLLIGICHVRDELKAHGETGALDFAVIVLASPHARVDHELERAGVEPQQRRETTQVDRSKKLEELDTVFWVLGKVLVDHVQGAFENAVHDVDNLIFHHALFKVSR